MQCVCTDANARPGRDGGQAWDFKTAGWDDSSEASGICECETGSLFDCSGEIGKRSGIGIGILYDLFESKVVSSKGASVRRNLLCV